VEGKEKKKGETERGRKRSARCWAGEEVR